MMGGVITQKLRFEGSGAIRNSYKEEWLAGLFTSTSKAKEILVKFKGRKYLISYTDKD